jgi:hypothetical protein
MAMWVRDPNRGGVKITPSVERETKERLAAHAEKQYAGKYAKLVVRFRGP